MQPILEEFLDKWVWPAGPGAPGAEFRLRLTETKCIKAWDYALTRTIGEIKKELQEKGDEWKRKLALLGYAGEGVQMSIKQMGAQLLSVDIADQDRYLDLQRMRARQVWDECKHSKLHVDVLLGIGAIKNERELMKEVLANIQFLPSFFGQGMMFAHLHPLARAGQHYLQEGNAIMMVQAYAQLVDDPLIKHEHLSQWAEEMMHFIEGKYQIDTYCSTRETQQVVEDTVDWLIHQLWELD